ncbi:DUF559 domain-containing protein [Schaalia sp. Marseille-Q2122]|uniref:DUF559 domain-containing protein n=1 Tax=Schaalia sp. Marseille-Q2122 TaxID=2736604 RepID=UPI0015898FD8|nr:DUF559 domain-containing protein [Schaalia sp. Marseille-Q2122]
MNTFRTTDPAASIEMAVASLIVSRRATSKRTAALLREGRIIRIFRNVYVHTRYLYGLGKWELYARVTILRACAVALALGERNVLSHDTALLMAGVELTEALPDIHVSRSGRWGGKAATLPAINVPGVPRVPAVRLIRHGAHIPNEWVSNVEGVRVALSEYAAAQCACILGPKDAVVTVSGALRRMTSFNRFRMTESRRRETFLRAEVASILEAMPRCQGKARARVVLVAADAGCESVPERELLWVLKAAGLRDVRTQGVVLDGGDVYYVDFRLGNTRIVIEFDGKDKYGEFPDQILRSLTARDQRQKRLEAHGFIVLRFEYFELANPQIVIDEVIRRAGLKKMPRPLWVLAA